MDVRRVFLAMALIGAGRADADWLGNVHCVGDSLTLGAGQGVRGGGYRWYLKAALARFGHTFDFVGTSTENPGGLQDPEHDGRGGWTTLDLLYGKQGMGSLQNWLPQTNPAIVLIMVGRNDPWPWTDTLDNYRAIAATVFAANPFTRIVWSNVTLPLDQGSWESAHCEEQDAALRTLVTELRLQGRSVTYVDNYRSLRGNLSVFSDTSHYNDSGYELIARGFMRGILLCGATGPGIKK